MKFIKKNWGVLFMYLFVIVTVVIYVDYANEMVLQEENSKVVVNK